MAGIAGPTIRSTRRGLHVPIDLFAVGYVPRRAPAADAGPAGEHDERHRPLADREPRDSPYGILPVWQFQGRETWTMIGYHAAPVIADAYLKGIRGFDADAALDAMVASATYAPYGGLGEYMKRGYVPIDREPEAASKTVEYAYDDWTIARMARAMGRTDVAETFEKRAGNWRNSFDAKTGLLRARQGRRQLPRPVRSDSDQLRLGLYRGQCLAI